MDKISVGDLVVVARLSYCCGKGKIGKIFRVSGFLDMDICRACYYCGEELNGQLVISNDDARGVLLSRLKKIPPLSELETIDEKEVIEL